MGLISCPDCRREVSDLAPACPGCGRPLHAIATPWASPPSPTAPLQTAPAPLPGTPAAIPVEPKALQIAFGLGLGALAAWLIAAWLPSHRPLSPAELAAYLASCGPRVVECAQHWTFKPPAYPWTFVVSGLLFLAGVEQIVRGATHRAYREVRCAQCGTNVVGRKGFWGVQCPIGQHLALQQFTRPILIVVLAVVAIVALESTHESHAGGAPPGFRSSAAEPSPPTSPLRVSTTGCAPHRHLIGLDTATATCHVVNTQSSTAVVNVTASWLNDGVPMVSAASNATIQPYGEQDVRVEIKNVNLGKTHNGGCSCEVQ